ncbi:MAG: hypothetical protein JWL59_3097 [Chthoniobacteraceae bacterium]|nr:hypothetical protein [Chthoniobacteraceae bacterium]
MKKNDRVLPDEEWDFRWLWEEVEGEQELACSYEYARESEIARRIFPSTSPDESVSLIDTPLIQVFKIFGGNTLNMPWKRVCNRVKKQLKKAQDVSSPCFHFGKMDIRAVTSKILPVTPHFDQLMGSELFMARICWRTTDNQLTQEFRAFLKDNRPAEFPEPESRGKRTKSAPIIRLQALGMMRLLHHFTVKELPERCPHAWKVYGGNGEDSCRATLYEGRKNARKAFLKLFPRLSSSEKNPRSWPTRTQTIE